MAQPALDVFHSLDQALAAAVAAAAPAVVHVDRGRSGGTGIAWPGATADLVITSSFHTPDQTTVGIATADGDLDRRDAEVIGRDAGTDVALLRVAGGGLAPAKLRELDGLSVGNLALALGRPGRSARASLRAIGVLGPEVRTAWGGRLDRYVESDRQIPRGFAGGPLIDADGAVIGMNTRTLLRGSDLAIPVITLRRVVDELVAHGGIRRGYLGVGAYPAQLPAPLAQLAAGRDRGALVASVEDAGPAATAGVQIGDILVEVEGTAVTGPDSLRSALGDRPGAAVTLVVLRGGARLELAVTLGSKP
ncbi:MAG: PDZ domain-containing protein [Deltaproteobacteria bacterium]|nr:PDZ domain-containing protein [Deltaproteobacteria bacterium]MDQ3295733.1 S1C family serine protease [Myxococcota bacterium]